LDEKIAKMIESFEAAGNKPRIGTAIHRHLVTMMRSYRRDGVKHNRNIGTRESLTFQGRRTLDAISRNSRQNTVYGLEVASRKL
jgi:hypothetical protein